MMKRATYISDVGQLLEKHYGISLEDAGLDADEWLDRFGDEPAADAVEAYAAKYDLTPLASAAFIPFSK
jgi:hypothetical protein